VINYLKAYKKFKQIEGRASVREYWSFTIVHYLIMISLFLWIPLSDFTVGFAPLIIYFVISFVPYITLTIRRLHDTNRDFWDTFKYSPIFLVYHLAQKGDAGRNFYGDEPK
jgi:uncharacterized membrane protein YhaH (DUF805 family)